MPDIVPPLVGQHIDISYVPEQDRLRLIVRNGEGGLSFWLTRRLCRGLLQGLIDLLGRTSSTASRALQGARDDVLLFEHVEAVSRRAPAGAAGSGGREAQVSSDPEAMLLQQIDLTATASNVRLSMVKDGSILAVMPLSRDNAHQLAGILYDRARLAEWDLTEFMWLDRRGQFVIPENLSPS